MRSSRSKAVTRAYEIAARVRTSRIERAWMIAHQAFGDPNPKRGEPFALGTTLHNALVSHDNGRPWRGVDYSLARLANHVSEGAFDAHRIAHALYLRLATEAMEQGDDTFYREIL